MADVLLMTNDAMQKDEARNVTANEFNNHVNASSPGSCEGTNVSDCDIRALEENGESSPSVKVNGVVEEIDSEPTDISSPSDDQPKTKSIENLEEAGNSEAMEVEISKSLKGINDTENEENVDPAKKNITELVAVDGTLKHRENELGDSCSASALSTDGCQLELNNEDLIKTSSSFKDTVKDDDYKANDIQKMGKPSNIQSVNANKSKETNVTQVEESRKNEADLAVSSNSSIRLNNSDKDISKITEMKSSNGKPVELVSDECSSAVKQSSMLASQALVTNDKPETVNKIVTAPSRTVLAPKVTQPTVEPRKMPRYGAFNQFVFEIGLDLVTERVYRDGQLQTEKNLEENPSEQMQDRLSRINKSLKKYQKKNEQFHFKQKTCHGCTFQTESDFVLELHQMFPHFENHSDIFFRCAKCEFKTRQNHKADFAFHMEAEHTSRARFERKRSFFECNLCHYEDNNKIKVAKHREKCTRSFKLVRNLLPVPGHEMPHPIPSPASIARSEMRSNATLTVRTASNFGTYRQIMPSYQVNTVSRPRYISVQQASKMQPPGYLNSRIIYSQGGNVLQARSQLYQPRIIPQRTVQVSNRVSTITTPRVPVSAIRPRVPIAPDKSLSTFVVCEICDGYIKDLESLQRHILWIHHVEVPNVKQTPPLKCSHCSSRFFTIKGLERHFQKTHKTKGIVMTSTTQNIQAQPSTVVTASSARVVPATNSTAIASSVPVPVALFQNISNMSVNAAPVVAAPSQPQMPVIPNSATVVRNRAPSPVYRCISCKRSFYSHLFWLKHIKEKHMPSCSVKLCGKVEQCNKCKARCEAERINMNLDFPLPGEEGPDIDVEADDDKELIVLE